MAHIDIKDLACGKWRDILRAIGVPEQYLNGRHQGCPFCGDDGKGHRSDRFRFDDKAGNGSFICSHCGAGSGVDFVMRWLKCDFITAKKEIEGHLGAARVVIKKASASSDDAAERMKGYWSRAWRLDGSDPVCRYLRGRGIDLPEWPSQLRYVPDAPYPHDDGSKTYHPAMLAKFVSPDTSEMSLHTTFLTNDGQKADVPQVKRNAKGKFPIGGAVRLSPSAETMGIAEGIETALSASILYQIPVWSALNSSFMLKWEPPKTARCIIIFGDNDKSHGGNSAAFSLSHRLRVNGFQTEVRVPDFEGDDWNDILSTRIAAQ